MIYLLYNKNYENLIHQIEQCRRYIKDNITLVHGPHRRNPYDSKVVITKLELNKLDINIKEIYNCNPSNSFFRMPELFNECLKEGNAMVLTNEIIPKEPIDYNDFDIAGSQDNRGRLTLEWFYSKDPIQIDRNYNGIISKQNPFIKEVKPIHIETEKIKSYLEEARTNQDIPNDMRKELDRLSKCGCNNGELERRWTEYLRNNGK